MTMLNQPVPVLPTPTIVGDVAAGTTLLGAIMNHFWTVLPGIVTVLGGSLAILWYCIQVWESKTCQTWHLRRLARNKAAKIAKLKAKERVITAQLEALELRRAAAATATELVAVAAADAKQDVVKATTAAAVADVTDPIKHDATPPGRVLDLDPKPK